MRFHQNRNVLTNKMDFPFTQRLMKNYDKN